MKSKLYFKWLSLIVNNVRSQLRGLPKKMAGPLSSITNGKEIEQLLRIEIKKLILQINKKF
jgi:hypothetical protein